MVPLVSKHSLLFFNLSINPLYVFSRNVLDHIFYQIVPLQLSKNENKIHGEAFKWLTSHDDDHSRIALICANSNRLCTSLLGHDFQQFNDILIVIAPIKCTIRLQQIPFNSDIPENEMVGSKGGKLLQRSLQIQRFWREAHL